MNDVHPSAKVLHSFINLIQSSQNDMDEEIGILHFLYVFILLMLLSSDVEIDVLRKKVVQMIRQNATKVINKWKCLDKQDRN